MRLRCGSKIRIVRCMRCRLRIPYDHVKPPVRRGTGRIRDRDGDAPYGSVRCRVGHSRSSAAGIRDGRSPRGAYRRPRKHSVTRGVREDLPRGSYGRRKRERVGRGGCAALDRYGVRVGPVVVDFFTDDGRRGTEGNPARSGDEKGRRRSSARERYVRRGGASERRYGGSSAVFDDDPG